MLTVEEKTDLRSWLARVDRLREQSDWAWREGPIEVRQTHISVVLLGCTQVLKLKKPVDFGFLDYTTLERRQRFCEAEVKLNRRLCPDMYLGAVPIVEVEGVPQLGGPGEPVEWGVLMQRLPGDRMLDEMVRQGTVNEAIVDRIAQRLAAFHATAHRGIEVDRYGDIATIRHNWDENFEQTFAYRGRTIAPEAYGYLREWTSRWMTEHLGVFEHRLRDGHIVDGHGDVRCESICAVDGVCLFDCIEFNERFRCGDVAGEAAFLAMDLDARGRPDLGYWFAERYRLHSHDRALFRLLPFYRCYRAYVRGKVQSFRIDEPGFSHADKHRAAEKAREFFDLALRYASPLRNPTVIAVAGLSGTGKTSLSRAIAGELGVEAISTDTVRADLFGQHKRASAFGTGVYGSEPSRRTYEELFERGLRSASEYGSVVLDGAFLERYQREGAASLAVRSGAALRWIECGLPPDAVRERMDRRRRLGDGNSDASWDIYLRQRELRTPLDEAAIKRAVDTSAPLARCSREACEWLRHS